MGKRRKNARILRHEGALEYISVGRVKEITHRGRQRSQYIRQIVENQECNSCWKAKNNIET